MQRSDHNGQGRPLTLRLACAAWLSALFACDYSAFEPDMDYDAGKRDPTQALTEEQPQNAVESVSSAGASGAMQAGHGGGAGESGSGGSASAGKPAPRAGAGAGEGAAARGGAGVAGMAGMTSAAPAADGCERTPDADAGVFVSLAGRDDSQCGSMGSPCRTLEAGLAQAEARGRPKLYVGRGQFDASFELFSPITLSGGWDAAWQRDCQRSDTVLKAKASADTQGRPVVSVRDVDGQVRLEQLALHSKDQPLITAGESVYGLFVVGVKTRLQLAAVDIKLAHAGDGSAGAPGTPASAAVSSCNPADGAAGVAGARGSAVAGQFSAQGYTPGDGRAGTPGSAGAAGSRSLAREASANTYACQSPCGEALPVTLPKGEDGRAGCGGPGGAAATPGSGGGSSVALYVWGADVQADGGFLQAGDGGDGGAGAEGGKGGRGAPGVNGAAGRVVTIEPSCCGDPTNVSAPGGTGMAGGDGGRGGDAAGGSGGFSYAVYVGGSGRFEAKQTVLQAGAKGKGGAGLVPGLDGEAAPRN